MQCLHPLSTQISSPHFIFKHFIKYSITWIKWRYSHIFNDQIFPPLLQTGKYFKYRAFILNVESHHWYKTWVIAKYLILSLFSHWTLKCVKNFIAFLSEVIHLNKIILNLSWNYLFPFKPLAKDALF